MLTSSKNAGGVGEQIEAGTLWHACWEEKDLWGRVVRMRVHCGPWNKRYEMCTCVGKHQKQNRRFVVVFLFYFFSFTHYNTTFHYDGHI